MSYNLLANLVTASSNSIAYSIDWNQRIAIVNLHFRPL